MKRLRAPLQGFRILLVIRRHSGVEIPAVVVESAGSYKRSNVIGRLVLEKVKSHHDIGNLDSGVVYVVLNFNLSAARAQHANKSIPKNRVSNVANVGRLVGIYVRVFNDNLALGGCYSGAVCG